MQVHLRQNNDELQDYLKGLDSWEEEMKEKDQKLMKNKSILKEVTIIICYIYTYTAKMPTILDRYNSMQVQKVLVLCMFLCS